MWPSAPPAHLQELLPGPQPPPPAGDGLGVGVDMPGGGGPAPLGFAPESISVLRTLTFTVPVARICPRVAVTRMTAAPFVLKAEPFFHSVAPVISQVVLSVRS